jgi:hypothetical protein
LDADEIGNFPTRSANEWRTVVGVCRPKFIVLPCAPTSPGADVAGVGPVPVQMWQGRAQSRCRCGQTNSSGHGHTRMRVVGWGARILQTRKHTLAVRCMMRALQRSGPCSVDRCCTTRTCHRAMRKSTTPCGSLQIGTLADLLWGDWAHPCHICTGTGRTPATSALGLGSPQPTCAQGLDMICGHSCTKTGLAPVHICIGTGLAPATAAPRLGSPLPHLHWDWAHPATSAPGLGSPLPHLHWDWAHPRHICTGTGLHPPICSACERARAWAGAVHTELSWRHGGVSGFRG